MAKRIKRLEAEVFFGSIEDLEPPRAKRGRGRPARLETRELLQRRDRLVSWLEHHWPYLSVALLDAKNPHDVGLAMLRAKRRMAGVFPGAFQRAPEEHREALWKFLKGGRYKENPRNLAGALAGIPELSMKRSFDVCAIHPSKLPLAPEAVWDYLQRRFPDRWLELRKATTTEEARVALNKSRSRDLHYLRLKENPERALADFYSGRPPERLPAHRQGPT